MAPPIYKPFILNDKELIASMLSDFAKRFQTCIPAIVKKVISRDTVEVSPAVLQSDSYGNPIEWANIQTTVLTPFSGGILLSMPLAVGDTGWLVASDLDTSKFKKGKKPSQQVSFSRHKYQYGFFVPDAINGYTISEDDNGAVVLTTIDGKTKIVLKDKKIELKTDGDLKINANNVIITGSSSVKINNVNWLTHTHSGVTSGGSSTGGVVA